MNGRLSCRIVLYRLSEIVPSVLKRYKRTVVSDRNFVANADTFFGIKVTPTMNADVLADVKIMPADDLHVSAHKNIIAARPSKRLEQNPA